MARGNKKEDFFDLLVKAPWWVSFILGMIMVFVVRGTACAEHFRRLLYFVLGVIFLASLISLMTRLKKNQLYQQSRKIDEIRNLSWQDFESFVGEIFQRQGYRVEETGGGGADGGVDLVLRRSNEKVLVQCKQWRTYHVGVKIVREMYGLLVAEQANRVIIVSVGTYTKDAADFARGKSIELINGDQLVSLRLGQGLEIKAQDESGHTSRPPADPPICPRCGADMVLRTAKKGMNVGERFWGCSRYPACKGIIKSETTN